MRRYLQVWWYNDLHLFYTQSTTAYSKNAYCLNDLRSRFFLFLCLMTHPCFEISVQR